MYNFPASPRPKLSFAALVIVIYNLDRLNQQALSRDETFNALPFTYYIYRRGHLTLLPRGDYSIYSHYSIRFWPCTRFPRGITRSQEALAFGKPPDVRAVQIIALQRRTSKLRIIKGSVTFKTFRSRRLIAANSGRGDRKAEFPRFFHFRIKQNFMDN